MSLNVKTKKTQPVACHLSAKPTDCVLEHPSGRRVTDMSGDSLLSSVECSYWLKPLPEGVDSSSLPGFLTPPSNSTHASGQPGPGTGFAMATEEC